MTKKPLKSTSKIEFRDNTTVVFGSDDGDIIGIVYFNGKADKWYWESCEESYLCGFSNTKQDAIEKVSNAEEFKRKVLTLL